MMKYGNLHLHSTHSDCEFRPGLLPRLAKSLGYGALALTDHEAISGLPELFAAAKAEGMEAMAGAEFYAKHNGKSFHVVGLDFDYKNKQLNEFIDVLTENQVKHMQEIVKDAVGRGVWPNVTWDDILRHNPPSIRWFCNDQIYHALDEMGIVEFSDRDTTWYDAFKAGEAYKKYKPQRFSAKEVIDVIHAAGGLAILAHPDEESFDGGYVESMIEIGLDGIETCHPDITERAVKLGHHMAMKHNLYCSGGTDHTGPMSACGGQYAIPAYQGVTLDEFKAIKERRFG